LALTKKLPSQQDLVKPTGSLLQNGMHQQRVKSRQKEEPIANDIFHSIMNAKKKGLRYENSSFTTMVLACAVLC
jgi:hypothetical protein